MWEPCDHNFENTTKLSIEHQLIRSAALVSEVGVQRIQVDVEVWLPGYQEER